MPIVDRQAAPIKAQAGERNHTLLDDLRRVADLTPNAPAVIEHRAATGDRLVLTYADLATRANRIASGLAGRGVVRGDVVSCIIPNWWQFAALHLACLRVGAVINPLMPIFRERELRFMLNMAESKAIIIPKYFRGFDYTKMMRDLGADIPRLRCVIVIGGEGEDSLEQIVDETRSIALDNAVESNYNEVIQILYTSGTTGEPKGVMHSSKTLFSNIIPYAERMRLGADDIIFMASPLAHQTGFLFGMMLPIYLGCPIVLQDIWNADRAVELIRQEGITFTMASTPFLADLTQAVEKRSGSVPSLRTFVAAGAPVPRTLVRRASNTLDCHVVSAWGMTENGAVTTTKLNDPPEKTFETDGCPMPGMEIRVVSGEGTVAMAGTEGLLQVRGCSSFLGYLKRPDLNATDAEGWFDTGDIARIDADGYVRITGRAKDVIIRGGENVPVIEVEELLSKHPDIADVAIVAMPDERLGERACAFIVTRVGTRLSLEDIVAFLDKYQMAIQYMPERVEIVSEMPRTASGKIQKAALREIAKTLGPLASRIR